VKKHGAAKKYAGKLPRVPRQRFSRRRKSISGDFHDSIIGVKSRRARLLRRFTRTAIRGLLLLIILAFGFSVTEILLRISELPPAAHAAGTTLPPGQTPQTEPAAAPAPAVPQPELRALYAPLRMLDSRERTGRMIQQAQAEGCNAAVILIKDKEGYLTYNSGLGQMQTLRASRKARQQVEACLQDYKAAGIRVVALVHCFRDNLAAGIMMDGTVLQKDTTKPTPWRDALSQRWLNPYSEAAQNYILGIIQELAALGVDDVLLDSVCFPGGNLQAAVFTGEETPGDLAARNNVLRDFLQKAKAAAGGARLLALMPAKAALDGAEEYGGDLWNSAADAIAVDNRDAGWALDAGWNAGQPTIQVFSTLEQAAGQERFLLIEEEAQG
jgi:hypothetical protein